jgi:putative DNA primase/helicase
MLKPKPKQTDVQPTGATTASVAPGPENCKQVGNGQAPANSKVCYPLGADRGRTDIANAARFVRKHHGTARYVGRWGRWLVWDGRRWQLDDCHGVVRLAKEVAEELWQDFGKMVAGGDRNHADKCFPHVKYSSSERGVTAMVALARNELALPYEQLNQQPWLLNVPNGTLDLRTGTLRPHRREDYLTALAPVAFDPAATCPTWDRFLADVFQGNTKVSRFFYQLAGYALTGVVRDCLLPLLFGTGQNGKTTVVKTLLNLLGPDYACVAPKDLLVIKRNDAHPTELTTLYGKRLVVSMETDSRRLSEALVKHLTGGDPLTGRRMREDFWQFPPTHKLWMAGNYKPVIRGTDLGIWSRVKLLPFLVYFARPDEDGQLPAGARAADTALQDKLDTERPGILNRLLAGCIDWLQGGLVEPREVQLATREYAREMDEVGQFLDECCVLDPEAKTAAEELFRAFQDTYPDSDKTQHTFGAELSKRGCMNNDPRTGKPVRCTTGPYMGRHAWLGIRLDKVPASADQPSPAPGGVKVKTIVEVTKVTDVKVSKLTDTLCRGERQLKARKRSVAEGPADGA